MILRTKRKIIKDPHGYSVGKITSKNGKGFHSTTESFESVKSFCESAWLDGFTVYAQKMYVEGVNPADGRTATPPAPSTEPVNPDLQGTDRRAPNKDKEKEAKSWWESLSEKDKKWIKGALIAAGTGITLAAAYKMYKSSHENDDPQVQKAYSEAFMNGFDYYTERYFSEKKDDNTSRNIAIGVGLTGAGTLAGTAIAEHGARKRFWDKAEKSTGETYNKNDRKFYEKLALKRRMGADAEELEKHAEELIKKYKIPIETDGLKHEMLGLALESDEGLAKDLTKVADHRRRNRWIQPIAATALAGSAGYGVYRAMKNKKKDK